MMLYLMLKNLHLRWIYNILIVNLSFGLKRKIEIKI